MGDAWISLAGVACATNSVRIGAMITPLVRRRPQIIARQAVTLDQLSSGRLVLGFGLGVDSTGELSRFGEIVDPVRRGDLLDEGGELLVGLLSGQQVEHCGPYFTADGVQFLPRSVQEPRIPVWFAAVGRAGRTDGRAGPAARPVRRAARYDGLFLIEAGPKELERTVAIVSAERQGTLEGFDIAVLTEERLPLDEAEALGATWAMLTVGPDMPLAEVRARIDAGPPA